MFRYIIQPLVFFLMVALPAIAQNSFVVTALTDRPDALYHINETVLFRISVKNNSTPVNEGSVTYTLSNDGWKTLDTGTRSLSSNSVTLRGTLSKPGFLRCTVSYTDPAGKKHHAIAGAGFDPLDIKPSMVPPEDFDAFWAEQRKKLSAVPMNPRLTPVEAKVEGVVSSDLQLDCLGSVPVSGYFSRPSDIQPGSLPAVLWVHGAGVRSSIQRDEIAAEGMLVLDINAHGIPNGKPKEYYADLARGELADYRFRGREDRETYYFLGMYHRIMRALDFLTAQPAWDKKTLIVRGSSQGGGQSLVAAGLDRRITALIANVPAMCDHTGSINGWPRLVPRDAQGNPDPKIQQVSRYFDAMNFATRSTADALVSVGFIDTICRPTSVYAAYNNLRGKKQMLNKPRMKHAYPPRWNELALAMMKEHITATSTHGHATEIPVQP